MKQFNSAALSNCCILALPCLIFLVGCGPKSSTIPVQGQVILNGKPLAGGTLTFHPVNVSAGAPNHMGQGTITPEGNYSVSTFQAGDGVMAGDYIVTIQSIQASTAFDVFSKPANSPKGVPIPAVYSDPDHTPLKATVPDGSGPQQINFELKSS